MISLSGQLIILLTSLLLLMTGGSILELMFMYVLIDRALPLFRTAVEEARSSVMLPQFACWERVVLIT